MALQSLQESRLVKIDAKLIYGESFESVTGAHHIDGTPVSNTMSNTGDFVLFLDNLFDSVTLQHCQCIFMISNSPMSPSPALKIYIQDIYRAIPTDNKYVHELFSMRLKNITIHGVVTQIYSIIDSIVNFELTDATGSVHVFYNSKKSDFKVNEHKLKCLCNDIEHLLSVGHDNLPILQTMKYAIVKKQEDQILFTVGNYLQVVGDIFTDKTRAIRMVSAFECNVTSPEREIVWLKELYYLYEKFYLWKKTEKEEEILTGHISNLHLHSNEKNG